MVIMIESAKINPDSFYIVEGRILLAANEAVRSLYDECLKGDDRRDRAQPRAVGSRLLPLRGHRAHPQALFDAQIKDPLPRRLRAHCQAGPFATKFIS